MDNDTSAREEKLLAAKKKLKKYQKKKANDASSVDKSSGKESQTDLLTSPTDSIASTENLSIATAENFSDDQTITFEGLANICRMQQQTITLLVEEKTALASELDKFSAMANRFKSSEELLKEGQLLVDALRRQNAELEEKVQTVEDQLKEANLQNENVIEKLQLQNAKIQQLENDNKQQLSQLNVKDSIVEQLKAEKNNNLSVSNQVETLQKMLKDKEERNKELETELTNFKLRFTNLEQQLLEKQEKILMLERRVSGEKQQTDGSLNHSKQKESLSSPTTTDRRISFSQFSSDFEIGRCSGCIGEIVII